MKFSEQWLRKWIKPDISTKLLQEQLTMAGLEVAAVTEAAPAFTGVVVGHVIAAAPHPDAKRLKCTQVDIGAEQPLDIVCGGVNVRANLKVVVATVGAQLPNGMKIKATKLRGSPSHGMICSANELGLGEGLDPQGGIYELPDDAPMGEDFRDYMQLNDRIIDIELTPNRGDCLSILGVAREVAVLNQLEFKLPKQPQIAPAIEDRLPITVNATNACPRYIGRVIRDIAQTAVTPLWMQEALRRGGIRCIHPVVDIGNYVMLELGQPLHAFDYDKLDQTIAVREARAHETMTLLDGQHIELAPGTLVIADASKPQALAGVMGGEASAVTPQTKHLFLESAFFNPVNVRLDAKRYGLQTDASYRFERGVDFALQKQAIERMTQLIIDIVGGKPGPVVEVVEPSALPQLQSITLRKAQIERLLGITIEDQRVAAILQSLGCDVSDASQGWAVVPPSYRFDITYEADLIEELARIYGYHHIPTQQMTKACTIALHEESQLPDSRLQYGLVDAGYHGVITYSFVNEEIQQLLDPQQSFATLTNPIAQDMAVMRTTLWSGLVQALLYNQNRQSDRVRLFEMGLVFAIANGNWQQTRKLGMIATGLAHPEQWSKPSHPLDFYDVKGDVESILALTGDLNQFQWVKGQHPALHPGQCAILQKKGRDVGYLGAIHPVIAEQLGLNEMTYVFEALMSAVETARIPVFARVSKFPAVRRDIAVIIEQAIPTSDMVRLIEKNTGKILNNVQIFDIYQGEGIEKGKKSVALGLTFQDPSRTLVDDEINEVVERIIMDLKRGFNATLRA